MGMLSPLWALADPRSGSANNTECAHRSALSRVLSGIFTSFKKQFWPGQTLNEAVLISSDLK